jgi:predicted DNA binding CopG/RHH family protein
MSKLPKNIKKELITEAKHWDSLIAKETPEKLNQLMDQTEPFTAQRAAKQPVSLRVDPFDLSMAKRLARRKGIPFSQLMAMWLHERIEQEKAGV